MEKLEYKAVHDFNHVAYLIVQSHGEVIRTAIKKAIEKWEDTPCNGYEITEEDLTAVTEGVGMAVDADIEVACYVNGNIRSTEFYGATYDVDFKISFHPLDLQENEVFDPSVSVSLCEIYVDGGAILSLSTEERIKLEVELEELMICHLGIGNY